ncbi:PRA1 family protein [Rhynchospora pubera]|uniref:PRA1 family protein n=1 Tax=Rhynchospora pubera TaxID=906938 RepID=A0AAV8FE97_9POAL|nr:PRA1 family protein [Rhynchospora pubera]
MSFAPNPLSLTVSDPAFESWLRDSGHLYTLDTLPASSSSSSSSSSSAPSASPSPSSSNKPIPTSTSTSQSRLSFFLSSLRTLATLISNNPLAKLQVADLAGPTPSWTRDFIGGPGEYSWPVESPQARLRVQENVRRYAKNYMFLSLLFFTCCLYRIPISLLGLVACLGIWEGVRFCIKSWEMEEKYPVLRQVMVNVALIITASVLYICYFQFALVYAIGLSYAAMLIHASLRKLTPLSKSNGSSQPKKVVKKSVRFSSSSK